MRKQNGYILIITGVLMSVLLMYSMSLVNLAMTAVGVEKKENFKLITESIANAGLEKAVWCFNQSVGTNCGGTYGSAFAGESDISFGGGMYDTAITGIDASTKQIEATAYYPNKTKILSKSIIKMRITTDPNKLSFVYGTQSGEGGVLMGEGAVINGSIYSNGSVTGGTGSTITGDAYVAGGTSLAADQSYTTKNADFIFGKTNPQIDLAQSFVPGVSQVLNKISLYIKRTSSAPGSLTIRIKNDNADDGIPGDITYTSKTLNASSVGTSYSWVDLSFSSPPALLAGTKYWLIIDASQNSTKYYTIGVDAFDGYNGGTMLYRRGDSYSYNISGKDINFKTWMGGVQTEIDNVTINGNAYAHSIDDATIGGNAFATNISDSDIGNDAFAGNIESSNIEHNASSTYIGHSSVGRSLWCGTKHDTSVGWSTYCPTTIVAPEDPGPANMPIADTQIDEWKTDALNGDIIDGSQTFSENLSLGPKKIIGNLTLGNGTILTLTGTLYVTGNIHMENLSEIHLDASYGSASGIIIADGTITIDQNAKVIGNAGGGYVLMISTLSDPMLTGIILTNGTNTALLYAPHSQISVGNATLTQITAYKIDLANNATLNYQIGLADMSFSSGPTGGWSKVKGSWTVVE